MQYTPTTPTRSNAAASTLRPPCIYAERRASQQLYREQRKKQHEQQEAAAEQNGRHVPRSIPGVARRLDALFEDLWGEESTNDSQTPAFVQCPGLTRSLSVHHEGNSSFTDTTTIQK